jgi:hypothetical protein
MELKDETSSLSFGTTTPNDDWRIGEQDHSHTCFGLGLLNYSSFGRLV